MPLVVDLDFKRYVEQRKGRRTAEAREGAAYAYPGDLRFLRTLEGARPVRMALEIAFRIGRGGDAPIARDDNRVTPRTQPALLAQMARAAEHLRVPSLPIHVRDKGPLALIGDEDEAALVIDADTAALPDKTLLHLCGGALGAMQNGHLAYTTARHHLAHSAGRFARWLLVPARVALDAWNRRAEITRDRAGLLATRDLEASIAAITALAPADEAALRHDALRLFADTTFYRSMVGEAGGSTIEACNAAVAERLSR